jgi:RND family efflux transporter MFP subunit
MRRLFTTAAATALGAAAIIAVSLVSSGQPLFGLLAGTGWQDRLVPEPITELVAPTQSSAARPGESGAPRVDVAQVTREDIPASASFSGRLIAPQRVELTPRVTGYLEARHVEDASFVEKGAVLFRLDPRTFEVRIDELQARLEGARASLVFFEREVTRIAELADEDFASQSNLDEIRRDRDAAAAQIGELEAQLERARLDLEFSVIKAPFDGKVGFSMADVGDLVTAGETRLATLVQVDPIEVEVQPSAGQLADLRSARAARGAPVPIRVRVEGDDKVHEGTIDGIGQEFDPATNTLAVRAVIANPQRTLVPGQFARVSADLGTRAHLTVPTRALVTSQNTRAVFRLTKENRIELITVETGPEHDGRTAVEGALARGDRVAVGKLQSLRPGQSVQPADPATTAARATEAGPE